MHLNRKQTVDAGVTTIKDCGPADIYKIAQKKGLFIAPKMEISVTPLVSTGGHFDLFLPSGFIGNSLSWISKRKV